MMAGRGIVLPQPCQDAARQIGLQAAGGHAATLIFRQEKYNRGARALRLFLPGLGSARYEMRPDNRPVHVAAVRVHGPMAVQQNRPALVCKRTESLSREHCADI